MGEHILEWLKRTLDGKGKDASPFVFQTFTEQVRREWKMSDGPASYRHLITEIRPWYKNPRRSTLCSTLCKNMTSQWYSRHSCPQLLDLRPVRWITLIQ